MRACFTRRAAVSVVKVCSGAKCAQPAFCAALNVSKTSICEAYLMSVLGRVLGAEPLGDGLQFVGQSRGHRGVLHMAV